MIGVGLRAFKVDSGVGVILREEYILTANLRFGEDRWLSEIFCLVAEFTQSEHAAKGDCVNGRDIDFILSGG